MIALLWISAIVGTSGLIILAIGAYVDRRYKPLPPPEPDGREHKGRDFKEPKRGY